MTDTRIVILGGGFAGTCQRRSLLIFIKLTASVFNCPLIHNNRSISAHAGYCTDSLSSVFRMKQEPWIAADAASNKEIIAAVQICPSGALSYTVDNVENHHQLNEPGIFIAPNGPYVVSGCPDLEDTTWAEGATKQQYTLCRCGASNNKPFCDGTHWSIEFKDNSN